MAKLDTLVEQVTDAALRCELAAAVRELRRHKTFGPVFEEHVPDIALLRNIPIRVGTTAYRRSDTSMRSPLAVTAVTDGTVTVSTPSGEAETTGVDDLREMDGEAKNHAHGRRRGH